MGGRFHRNLQETPNANISDFMQAFQSSYANWFRSKYKTVGSLFQSRFKSVLVEDESYLINLSIYIHLNPVRAKMVSNPEKYQYSSYVYFYKNLDHKMLTKNTVLKMSGGLQNYNLIVYRRMHKQIDPEEIYGRFSIIGSDEFRSHAITLVQNPEMIDKNEIPDYQKLIKIEKEVIEEAIMKILNVELSKLTAKSYNNTIRKIYFYLLKRYTALKVTEIAEIGNISYKAAGNQIRAFTKILEENSELRTLVDKIINKLKRK